MQIPNENENRSTRELGFFERVTTLECMKFFVMAGLGIKFLIIAINVGVLIYTLDQTNANNLRMFISIYTILLSIQATIFFSRHKEFFYTDRMPDFNDNSEQSLFSNIVGAIVLFWYLIGLHWTQDCPNCTITHPLLYYTSLIIVYFGLLKILAPLFALIILVIIIGYLNPKIPVIEYDKTKIKEEDARCSICLEKYAESVHLKVLPCGHHFHSTCIDGWFSVEELCPLCMKPLNMFQEMIEQQQHV